MFNRSALIVAHPDDDILWYSSIIEKVNNIFFCFSDYPPNPAMGEARRQTIAEYPLKNIASLNLTEPQAFDMSDWINPNPTEYGVELVKSANAESRYQETYKTLVNILREKLAHTDNVFTHNPWGEYGHEDHILVYRAIKHLQPTFGFKIWYSNYCSNRSFNLMLQHISGFNSNYVTLPTNVAIAEKITEIYKKNGCWTWYEDFTWFKEECLMQDIIQSQPIRYGHIFPLNIIKMHIEIPETQTKGNLLARGLGKIAKIFKK